MNIPIINIIIEGNNPPVLYQSGLIMIPVLNLYITFLKALKNGKQTDENNKNSKYFVIILCEEKLKKLQVPVAE